MCVTRFYQSESVICRVIFALGNGAVSRVVYDEIFALFQAWVGNFDTIPPSKVVGTPFFYSSYLLLNILLSWELETSLNCSVMCQPPRWFKCYFRRSSWIHCWLLLAVLSDYFGHLVSSTSILCKFSGLHGSTPDSFPIMRSWRVLDWRDRLTQVAQLMTTSGKRSEKTCRNGSRREACNAKSSIYSILNQNR